MTQVSHVDIQALITLIAAIGTLVGVITTAVLQVLASLRQTKQLELSQSNATTSARIETLVNGNTARMHDIFEKAIDKLPITTSEKTQ